MIVYQATKAQFLHHAFDDDIEDVVLRHYVAATGHRAARPEVNSWAHSLIEMVHVALLRKSSCPE